MHSAVPGTPAAVLAPPWGGRARTIVCHRADLDSTEVPNSLRAVQAAVAVAAPRIEVDLRFLADDAMVVFHDADLAPSTDGRGALDGQTGGSIAAVRYHGFGRPPIATFAEVVDAVTGSATTLQVDLKHDRPLPPARAKALADALQPIRDHAIVGTQAYWNLEPLARLGPRVALDPGMLIQRGLDRRPGDREFPATRGLYGFWDDSPLAHLPGVPVADYLGCRLADLRAVVPSAEEWLVDIDTILHCENVGLSLPAYLHREGIRLAAWTIEDRDLDAAASRSLLARLFDLDVDVVIAKHALTVGGYLSPRTSPSSTHP